MGLLTPEEHDQLLGLLETIPHCEDREVRHTLLFGLPRSLRLQVPDHSVPKAHLLHMVDMLDDLSTEPYEGIWPIVQLINRAIQYVGFVSPSGQRLKKLLEQVQQRADQWSRWSKTFMNLPPQPSSHLERLIDTAMGFHNPLDWRRRMYQSELATCLIAFTGYTPAAQGTGFLVGPDLLITNYHVMEDVLRYAVSPRDVRFYFDYKEGQIDQPIEYTLAPDYCIDWSVTNELDYVLIRLSGAAGEDFVDDIRRGWLRPVRHTFQSGEPLFILQHPAGGPLKFAFDRVKWSESTRLAYWTNTGNGSSGSPCFTLTWDLVALHQGVVPAEIDPERPNRGIPFSWILDHSGVQALLFG